MRPMLHPISVITSLGWTPTVSSRTALVMSQDAANNGSSAVPGDHHHGRAGSRSSCVAVPDFLVLATRQYVAQSGISWRRLCHGAGR